MRFLFEALVVIVVVITIVFVYATYGEQIKKILFVSQEQYVVYIGDVAVKITVADTEAERKVGLSGVASLEVFEGKLFIFDSAALYGMWMKDMMLSLDIIWLDEDLRVVHIEQNVSPNTYPKIFIPDAPSRFVLETNAYFVDALKITEGDRINLPSEILPPDIKQRLQ